MEVYAMLKVLVSEIIQEAENLKTSPDYDKLVVWQIDAKCVSTEIALQQAVDLNRIANALEELVRR